MPPSLRFFFISSQIFPPLFRVYNSPLRLNFFLPMLRSLSMAPFFTYLLLTALLPLTVTADDVRSPLSYPTDATTTTAPPPQFTLFQPLWYFTSVVPILTDLGFHDLAIAAQSLSVSTDGAGAWPGPITIFAPADSAVRSCPSCSTSLLLQEHAVPGLFHTDYLRRLTFGTKIETIIPGRCLTVTSAVNGSKIFIGGAEITRPDLFNNGHVIIHGLQGFVSHLSPYSCSIDKLTSLSLPHHTPALALMRVMLYDAMLRLRMSGYGMLALALRFKYHELVNLHNMTLFAVDDAAIFHGGHSYIHDVRFHIVPNQLLRFADLEYLPASTLLPSLVNGESLVVTTAAGGSVAAPVRINYARIKVPDLIHNAKIAIHGLAMPLPHLYHSDAGIGRSGYTTVGTDIGRSGYTSAGTDAGSEMLGKPGTQSEASTPVAQFLAEFEDHHGL